MFKPFIKQIFRLVLDDLNQQYTNIAMNLHENNSLSNMARLQTAIKARFTY